MVQWLAYIPNHSRPGREYSGGAGASVALAVYLAAVTCVLTACGCRAGSCLRGVGATSQRSALAAEPKKTVIRFSYWALNRRENVLVWELKRRFEARNPDIHVEVVGVPQRYYDKLQTLMVAGDCPDVFTANYGRLADFVRAGAVMDLTKFIGQSPDLRSVYLPAAWSALEGLSCSLGRPGIWGLPRDWPPAGLVLYNADLLAAAGVEPPGRRPWGWEDFRRACRAVAAAGFDGVYPTAINLYPYSFFTWLRQANAQLFGPDGLVLADSPGVADTIDFALGLWREGLAPRPSPGRDESFELFRAGRVALIFGTFYNVQACREILSFEWGVAEPLEGRVRACSCLPTFVAVSATTPHARAAWRWARFLSVEGAEIYARSGVAAPAAAAALAEGVFLASPPLDRAREAVLKAMNLSQPPPLHPDIPYERVVHEIRTVLEEAIARDLTGRQAATLIARRLRKARRAAKTPGRQR